MSTPGPEGTPVAATPPGRPGSPPTPGPVRKWWLGARPRTLPAALVPVAVGTAAAHALHMSAFSLPSHGWVAYAPSQTYLIVLHGTRPRVDPWWCAFGALVVALALQIGTNYANDYSDGIRGTDDARVGPVRLVASGLASPSAVKRAALASFAVAGVAGLGLAWATSWWILLVGAACVLAGWLYTGGPRPYGYAGLGELFVFVFFGLVATVGTFYVQTLQLGVAEVWVAAVMVGLLATALLLANNLRDIATDGVTGKRTLAVRIGRRAAGWCYVACVGVPVLGVAVWGVLAVTDAVQQAWPAAAFLPLLAAPLAIPPARLAVSSAEGRALLPVLAATGRLQLAFGGLLALALWMTIPDPGLPGLR
ncbi:MAG: 1,4-dihydroxy-2-naphthoate polyprenyltransferase [Acidimicrobiales bacterium]